MTVWSGNCTNSSSVKELGLWGEGVGGAIESVEVGKGSVHAMGFLLYLKGSENLLNCFNDRNGTVRSYPGCGIFKWWAWVNMGETVRKLLPKRGIIGDRVFEMKMGRSRNV